jgi:hypothetical protein
MAKIIWPKIGLGKRIGNMALGWSWEPVIITIVAAAVPVIFSTVPMTDVVKIVATGVVAAKVNPTFLWCIIPTGILVILAVASLAYKASIQRMYDPTLELKFEEEFSKMPAERSRAAGVLLLYSESGTFSGIDGADLGTVLDFFDNLGFYYYGKQLSERVIHQGFAHWLLLYYQHGQAYIEDRRNGPDCDKSTWEYIEDLVRYVAEIEAAKNEIEVTQLQIPPASYRKYLLEELGEDEEYYGEFGKAHPQLIKQLAQP